MCLQLIRSAVLRRKLTDEEAAAYGAPFPDGSFQTGALVFPRLVPIRPDHAGAYDNRPVIERLKTLDLPVLLPWADKDPITGPWEIFFRKSLQERGPSADHPRCRPFPSGGCRGRDRRSHSSLDVPGSLKRKTLSLKAVVLCLKEFSLETPHDGGDLIEDDTL